MLFVLIFRFVSGDCIHLWVNFGDHRLAVEFLQEWQSLNAFRAPANVFGQVLANWISNENQIFKGLNFL